LAIRCRADQLQNGGRGLAVSARSVASVSTGFTIATSGCTNLRSTTQRRKTVDDRAFSVAGANVWNSLPDYVTSSSNINTSRASLKTHLFGFSFHDSVTQRFLLRFPSLFVFSPCLCINDFKTRSIIRNKIN
jgi:hypothetical protein